jgi:hypothetical protein
VLDEPTLSHTSCAPVSYAQERRFKLLSYQNEFPILARQVLVSGLDDGIVEDVGLGAEHDVCVSPVWDGKGDRQGRNCGLGVTREGREGTKGAEGYSRGSKLW